jgi:hypothetical protein
MAFWIVVPTDEEGKMAKPMRHPPAEYVWT